MTIDYLNEKNTYLRIVWNVICPIPSQIKFLGDFWFSSIFHSLRRTKKWQNWEGKIAPWYMTWGYIKSIQRKNKDSSLNNCNKIFGLLKPRNFRTPNKSDTKVKTRHSLSRIWKWKINNAFVKKIIGRFGGKISWIFRIKSYFWSTFVFPAAQITWNLKF